MSCLAAATIISTSCSKDDDNEPSTVGKIITKIVRTTNNSLVTSTYDNKGRILTQTIKQTIGDNNIESTGIYEYTNNTMTVNNTVYTIENGRITEGVGPTLKYTFTYSSNGYLSSKTVESSEYESLNTTYKYSEKNGNIVSYDFGNSDDTKTKIHYSIAYTDKPNNYSVDIAGMLTSTGGYDLLGKRSNNLPSQICWESPSLVSTRTTKISFNYTYDGDYIVKIIEEQDGETTSTLEIFYE